MKKQHSCLGFAFVLQLLYQLVQIFVQTTIALEVVTSYKLLYLLESLIGGGSFIPGLDGIGLLNIFFLMFLFFTFLLSLFAYSSSPGVSKFYSFLSYALMVINIIKIGGLFIALRRSLHGSANETTLLLLAIMSLYFIIFNYLILCLIKPKQFCVSIHRYIISCIFYLLFVPTFSLMIKLYVVCNYHDFSWGSRRDEQKRPPKIIRKYRLSTLLILVIWAFVNGFLICLILLWTTQFILIAGTLAFLWTTIRAVQALIFWIKYCTSLKQKVYGNYLKVVPTNQEREGSIQIIEPVMLDPVQRRQHSGLGGFIGKRRENSGGREEQRDYSIEEQKKSSVDEESEKQIELDVIKLGQKEGRQKQRKQNASILWWSSSYQQEEKEKDSFEVSGDQVGWENSQEDERGNVVWEIQKQNPFTAEEKGE